MSIGATTVIENMEDIDSDDEGLPTLWEQDDVSSDSSSSSSSSSSSTTSNDSEAMDLLGESDAGLFDFNTFMASAASANQPRGVKPSHLSKIWRISHDEAKATLESTSQRSVRTDNPTLSRNYGTNDRMLRYKRLNDYFFMDTFFSTVRRKKKTVGTSTRGNTCCQVFVTDKNFVYVVPMRSKSQIPQALWYVVLSLWFAYTLTENSLLLPFSSD